MKVTIITLFPEMFAGVFDHSMLFKAQDKNILELEYINLRDYGEGERRTVDDQPYGGGDGMLLKVEPLKNAIESALSGSDRTKTRVLLMTPRGATFTQATAQKYASDYNHLIFVCGRYEGYDERIMKWIDDEVSVGKYVLTGGEIPAMIIIDSVVRLIPGVLGGETSAEIESFADGETVEFPQYTRPAEFEGMKVPDVLLSGNHGEIEKWRQTQAQKKTDELSS